LLKVGREVRQLLKGPRGPARLSWLLYFAAGIHTVARLTWAIMGLPRATLGGMRDDASVKT